MVQSQPFSSPLDHLAAAQVQAQAHPMVELVVQLQVLAALLLMPLPLIQS